MRTRGLALGAMVVALAMLAACGSSKSNGSGTGSSDKKIVVGAKNFPAAQLISDIYGGALAAKGFTVSYKDVGPTEQTYAAIKNGSIGLYGEYQGTLLTYLNGAPTSDPAAVNSALSTKLKADKLDVSPPSTAIDVNAFYVTKATADKYHLTKISDLKPIADQLTFGGPPECADRPLCLGATEQALYDLHFKTVKKLDEGGPITDSALEDGDIQVGLLFSGSSVLDKDFVQLQDDKGLQPADAVVAVWRQSVDSSDLSGAIDAVNAKLTTDEYNKLNAEINGSQKLDPKDAASQWLKDQGLSS
ncbi:MAG TPA: ABC transporter substrate-binding protein [Acidimicrobiia bacterium]|nr:ABC transporter substrate-binding protein [Acidimicrobiia bacterium]